VAWRRQYRTAVNQQSDDGAGDRSRSGRAAASAEKWLLATAFLGIAFVCIKGYGWCLDQQDQVVPAFNFIVKPHEAPAAELVWVIYFVAPPCMHCIC
jgi:hypothetical protein